IPSQARNRLYGLYLMENDFAKHAPFGGRAHRLMAVRPWAYAHWGSRGDERGSGASAREMGVRNTKERADVVSARSMEIDQKAERVSPDSTISEPVMQKA